jgi:hypothetical protein
MLHVGHARLRVAHSHTLMHDGSDIKCEMCITQLRVFNAHLCRQWLRRVGRTRQIFLRIV